MKIAKAAHASGFVNAILRRAAREREELTAALLGDDSTPEAAATAHSAPLWLARMWWEELGAEAARSLLAACNEPAEVAMRAADAEARADLVARLRGEGVDVSPAGGGWPLAVAGGDGLRRAGLGDSVPIAGRRGRADAAEPRLRRGGRGAGAAGGGDGARPLRRPGDQDRPDRDADGGPRRGDLGRARRDTRRRDRRPGDRGSTSTASPSSRATRPTCRCRRASTASSSTRPARTSARSPRAPTRAGANRRGSIERVAAVQEKALLNCGRSCCGRAARSSTRPARSPAARTRTGSRRCSKRAPPARRRRSNWTTSAPSRPGSPRRTSRARCSCAPTATTPPGSSSAA